MTATTSTIATTTSQTSIWPSVASLCAGFALLFVVGFSHLEAVHNAAHDTRHTAAFPCH